jgi:hypothetical protein
MESFVLICHEENTADVAGERSFAGVNVVVDLEEALADARLEFDDGGYGGPVFVFGGYFGVGLCTCL